MIDEKLVDFYQNLNERERIFIERYVDKNSDSNLKYQDLEDAVSSYRLDRVKRGAVDPHDSIEDQLKSAGDNYDKKEKILSKIGFNPTSGGPTFVDNPYGDEVVVEEQTNKPAGFYKKDDKEFKRVIDAHTDNKSLKPLDEIDPNDLETPAQAGILSSDPNW